VLDKINGFSLHKNPKGWLAKTRLYSISLAARIFSPEDELLGLFEIMQ
jgi:hypothetical protein